MLRGRRKAIALALTTMFTGALIAGLVVVTPGSDHDTRSDETTPNVTVTTSTVPTDEPDDYHDM